MLLLVGCAWISSDPTRVVRESPADDTGRPRETGEPDDTAETGETGDTGPFVWDGPTFEFFTQPTAKADAFELWSSNKGDGTFTPFMLPTLDLGGETIEHMLIADIVDDPYEWPDVLMMTSGGRLIRMSTQGNGKGWQTYDELMTLSPLPQIVGWGDFNGDGEVDAYGWDEEPLQGRVLLGRGDGRFEVIDDAWNVQVTTKQAFTGAYHTADMNGDGHQDLVTATSAFGLGFADVHYGRGDGTFEGPAQLAFLASPVRSIDVADLDRDGTVDLWAGFPTNGDSGQTWVGLGLKLKAGGIESIDLDPGTESGTPTLRGQGVLYDWTRDGYPDLLVQSQTSTGSSAYGVFLCTNDGSGGFDLTRCPPVLEFADNAQSLAVPILP